MEKNYTDKELELVFEKILKMYKSSYSPKEKPKVFLLGGQPGAGKTGLENMINAKDEYISISGDDFREYHPKFKEINLEHGREASKYTQQWCGAITEKLIEALGKEKYNLIIEGTLRTAELPIKEATRFKKLGYEVGLNVVAVKGEKSRLGTIQRYEEISSAEALLFSIVFIKLSHLSLYSSISSFSHLRLNSFSKISFGLTSGVSL